MTLAGERVLVTGATGLIGRHVVSLLRDQVEVYAVSRSKKPSTDRVNWLTLDLAQPGSPQDLIERLQPSVVLHLAGAVRGDRSLDAVHPTLTANLVATVELLEAATRARVRRIVVSGSLLEEPTGGGATVVPPSPYGASRWASTSYARMFHSLFEAPVTILRPSYAYGPGQDSTKLLPHVINSVLRGERPELASGERRIDFVFAEDVGRAYLAAARAPAVSGETIDIGSGVTTRVRDFVAAAVDMLGEDCPRPLFGALPERPFEQEIHVDTQRAERLLGWAASTSLDEGLRKTVAWYVRHAKTGA
jgi:nucleoside-diphosphate-sugar epimerase